jgi:hypothetical protein
LLEALQAEADFHTQLLRSTKRPTPSTHGTSGGINGTGGSSSNSSSSSSTAKSTLKTGENRVKAAAVRQLSKLQNTSSDSGAVMAVMDENTLNSSNSAPPPPMTNQHQQHQQLLLSCDGQSAHRRSDTSGIDQSVPMAKKDDSAVKAALRNRRLFERSYNQLDLDEFYTDLACLLIYIFTFTVHWI